MEGLAQEHELAGCMKAPYDSNLTSSLTHHLPCRSTAIEVALRMAMRKFRADHGDAEGTGLHVVGLAEGYHGDTLGATDAVAPSVYNGLQHYPWQAFGTLGGFLAR